MDFHEIDEISFFTCFQLYSELRKDNPTFVDRIMPILGDVSEINLGLDEKSWAILTDEVGISIIGFR